MTISNAPEEYIHSWARRMKGLWDSLVSQALLWAKGFRRRVDGVKGW